MPQPSGRTIRTKKTKAAGKAKQEQAPAPRDINVLVESLQKKQIEAGELADTLTDAEVTLLVDMGARLNDEISVAKKMLDPIKDLLKEYAKKTKTLDMSTGTSIGKMGTSTTTETGTPLDLIKLLNAEKKRNLINDLLSVKLTECKKYLGEKFLEAKGFIVKKSDPYGKISLKRK